MATRTTCPPESLAIALSWELARAEWLRRHGRRREAEDADHQAALYRCRLREIGVEVAE